MRQEHPESRIELQHNRPTLSILGIESGNVYTGTRSAKPTCVSRAHVTSQEPDAAMRRKYPLIARFTRSSGGYGLPALVEWKVFVRRVIE